MAEAQNDPLLPGYSFNAHLVAGGDAANLLI